MKSLRRISTKKEGRLIRKRRRDVRKRRRVVDSLRIFIRD